MSSVTQDTSRGPPRRTYITMRPYNNDIFSYTTHISSLQVVGSLTPLAGATAGNCPTGNFLRETGKKIFSGRKSRNQYTHGECL